MRKKLIYGLLAFGIGTGLGVSAQAGAIASGMMLASTCGACHGPNGSSYGPASPSIAGINAEYMIDTMTAFKSGERHSTIMSRIAKGYSDDEIKAIAKYLAAQSITRRVVQSSDPKKAEKGQALVREYCTDCHEKDGYSALDYPSLAGQPMLYLSYSLADFKSKMRDIEHNPSMSSKERRKKLRNLAALEKEHGQDGIEAVIHFLGSRK